MDTHLRPARTDDLLSSTAPAVRDFIQQQELGPAVEATRELVRSAFGTDVASLKCEKDPETGEEWISVGIAARGSQGDVLAARKWLVQAWVRRIPEEFRRFLRLSVRVA
jgi:hypothetical protein